MIDIDTIRDFLKDDKKNNVLLGYIEQFSEELIDTVIPMVYQEAAILYPALTKTNRGLPDHVVMYGVLSKIFESESYMELRNEVQYSDSNSNVALSTKNEAYTRKSELARTQFLKMLEALAATSFLETCWGASTSNAEDASMNMWNNNANFGWENLY